MKKRLPSIVTFAALALGLLCSPMSASATPDLSKFSLGTYVTGPKITNDDLNGRFVIVEYWGINCPPCIASIPKITELAKDYGHDRLVVVANHAQGGSINQIKEKWESRAKSNHVAVYNGGHLPGSNVRGIPDVFLFAPNGQFLWNGRPGGVEQALEQAMRSFRLPKKEKEEAPKPDPIVTGVEATYFDRQLEDINEQSRSIDRPLAQVRRFAERAPKEEQMQEAGAILAAVTDWAKLREQAIQSTRADDPAAAYAMAEKAIELFGRDELAKPFADVKAAMDADDKLMDRVRSMRMLREVIAEAESIGLHEDPAVGQDRRNARTVRAITRDLGRIIKNWPDTPAAAQAQSLQSKWGL
ncbi:MAG: TlpA family protein disulfide reductase [Phycisphaeraceae bacterium]